MALGTSAGDVYLDGHFRLGSNFGREMSRQVQTPAMRAGQEASRHFGRKFAAGLAIGGALIGAALVKGTRLAVRGINATTQAASDLNETVNKTKVIFGGSAKSILDWSRGSARALGLSRQEALASAAGFGDLFKQIGFGLGPTTKMSKGMVELSADLASFHNADITQVLEAQSAAFRGEYDSLQRFIPNINAARVQQVAMAQTGKENAQQLTAQEKALATYTIMLRDTKDAQGDFHRTNRDLANTRRIEQAQWKNLSAAMGKLFLPAQLAVHRALSEKVLPALGQLVKTYGPGVQRTVTRWAQAFSDSIPSSRQLSLGLKALSAAYREGDVTSDGFVGGMEKVGVGARKVNAGLHDLGPALRTAWQNFRATGVEAGDLAPTLRLSGAMFKFIADHADTLAKHIPLIVTGFLAYKAAQAAANVAQAVHAALLPAQVAGNFALARSNRALVASMGSRTAATVTLTAAEGGLVVSTTAAGTAAETAAGKFSRFGGAAGLARLGLLGAAAAAVAVAAAKMKDGLEEAATKNEKFGRTAIVGGKGGQFFAQRLNELDASQRAVSVSTAAAARAAELHTGRMLAARTASDSLRSALSGQRDASLDLRQAKLNVSTAQARLTELTKGGRKGSIEYKQAQIDLRRAQLDLKAKTDAYKTAQAKANAATGGAMRASQQATPQVKRLGDAAKTGGGKASNARVPWRKLGEDVAGTYREIHNKTAHITAKFGWQGLKVFNVGGGLKALAAGGRITDGTGPTADDVIVRASKGETVVSARDSAQPEFRAWAAQRRIPGFAAGGVIPRFGMQGARGFVNALGDWDTQVDKVLTLAMRRFKALAAKMGGGSEAIKAFIRSTDPLPYIWGGAGPGGYDCSGIVSAVLGKMTGRGGGRGQRYFTTGTIRSGILGIKTGLGGTLQIGVTPSRGHMAGRYGGLGFEAESSRTGIKVGSAASSPESFSRHFHLAKGGVIDAELLERFARLTKADIGGDQGRMRINGKVLDQGGWLMPGQVGVNRTSKPERVVGPGEQLIDYDRLGKVVAREFAKALREQPITATTYLDRQKVSRGVATGALWEARR